jgi:hypothetical protein
VRRLAHARMTCWLVLVGGLDMVASGLAWLCDRADHLVGRAQSRARRAAIAAGEASA